ncbi:hypothetical protein HH007_13145, partial [Treponema denticola]
MDWIQIIEILEKKLGLEGRRSGLAKELGINSSVISGIKSGKSKNPGSNIALLLINKLNVNPEWLETGKEPIFLQKSGTLPLSMQSTPAHKLETLPTKNVVSNGIESLALESTAPRFAELEEKISTQNEKLNNLQAQIDELKGAVEKKLPEEANDKRYRYT